MVSEQRLGIAIDLDQLEQLMKEYLEEEKRIVSDADSSVLSYKTLSLSLFLTWMRRRQAQPSTTTTGE